MRILLLFTVLAARTSVLLAPHTHTHTRADCTALNSVLPLYNGNENENKFPFGTSFYMPQCLLQQFHTHTHTSHAPSLAPPLSLSLSLYCSHSFSLFLPSFDCRLQRCDSTDATNNHNEHSFPIESAAVFRL